MHGNAMDGLGVDRHRTGQAANGKCHRQQGGPRMLAKKFKNWPQSIVPSLLMADSKLPAGV
jgi:hypothetical protein